MVNNTIHATYTETYDLNTAVGEMSLLAIHTPQADSMKRMFRGFFEQYKKYKILGCNFNMVCASRQELTPDLLGLSAGSVDPRDVLNPILFKACTGENLDALLNQIYNATQEVDRVSSSVGQHIVTGNLSLNAYYQLLASNEYRKAHPQAGLTISGLRPMVHKVVTTQPFKWTGVSQTTSSGVNSRPSVPGAATSGSSSQVYGFGGPSGIPYDNGETDATNPTVFVSDGVTEMPWLETAVVRSIKVVNTGGETESSFPMPWIINDVPRVYMGVVILPPAILQPLYFRLSIVWHVLFKDFRPAFELGSIAPQDTVLDIPTGIGSRESYYSTYWNLYHTPNKLDREESSFSTTGVSEVDRISESVA